MGTTRITLCDSPFMSNVVPSITKFASGKEADKAVGNTNMYYTINTPIAFRDSFSYFKAECVNLSDLEALSNIFAQ